jgi:catechol 2,3-dioxygenase-like lactoylglutathione lyase family enzyme
MENNIAVVITGVTDMERAVRFYRDVLGLTLKFQTDEYSEFATKGAVLALEKRPEVIASGPAFTFPTTDIRADHHKLQSAQVTFWKDLHAESFGQVLMPKDSEGNIFEIVEYRD